MFMGLWIVVVVVAVILVASQASTSGGQSSRGSSAREILDQRLASGELTPDEHAARSAVLGVEDRSRPRWSPVVVVGLGVAAVVLAGLVAAWGSDWNAGWMGSHMGWGTTTSADADPYPDAREVIVEAGDVWFEPDQVEVDVGEEVNLRVVNTGDAFHDLTVPAADVRLDVEAGDEVVGGLRLDEPGTYEFYCSVPGHAAAGMSGTITVTG